MNNENPSNLIEPVTDDEDVIDFARRWLEASSDAEYHLSSTSVEHDK